MIETRRLRLIPATLETLRAELEHPTRLHDVLRMEVAEEWPPELYDRDPIEFTIRRLALAPEEAHWWLYYFALKGDGGGAGEDVAVGCGGFKGPPANGEVEIGYSIVSGYRRRGLATEAAAGLVRHAFGYPDVALVAAETLPALVPSIGVLEKCGFRFSGPGSEEGVIRYTLLRATWEAAGAPPAAASRS